MVREGVLPPACGWRTFACVTWNMGPTVATLGHGCLRHGGMMVIHALQVFVLTRATLCGAFHAEPKREAHDGCS